jgi:hypothetical protein
MYSIVRGLTSLFPRPRMEWHDRRPCFLHIEHLFLEKKKKGKRSHGSQLSLSAIIHVDRDEMRSMAVICLSSVKVVYTKSMKTPCGKTRKSIEERCALILRHQVRLLRWNDFREKWTTAFTLYIPMMMASSGGHNLHVDSTLTCTKYNYIWGIHKWCRILPHDDIIIYILWQNYLKRKLTYSRWKKRKWRPHGHGVFLY